MSYFEQTKITKADGTVINPIEDETVFLLRKMVKLLESNGTVDYANRQRVVLDSLPGAAVSANIPISGSVTIASGSVTATMTSTTLTGISGLFYGMDPRCQYIDAARLTYAAGIRNNLIYS